MTQLKAVDLNRKSPSLRPNVVRRPFDVADLIVDRTPCARCGARKDFGCACPKAFA
jgi:hypothetical protein